MEEKISIESPFSIPTQRSEVKEFLKSIPMAPGVYKFLDKSHIPLYIGKAKHLHNRVSSYFRESSRSKKVVKLFEEAKFLEFAITNTELESLLLEQFLIKEQKPKYNVQFKDDKGYPWIKIENTKEFPSAKSFLGKKLINGKFFGPFPNSYAVRDALKLIQKTFKLRNCSDSYFRNRTRPCLQYEIGRCSAPCIGSISREDYEKDVQGAELLLKGKSEELIQKFYNSMDSFSLNKDYEKAALYRDRISALRDIQRTQSITGFSNSRDAIHIFSNRLNTKIGVTSVNHGWVTGHRNFTTSNDFDEKKLLEDFIIQNYFSASDCPSTLVVGKKIDEKKLLEKALSEKHSRNISIITKPGKKDKGLLEVCKANTEIILRREKVDKNIQYKLRELKEGLAIQDDINIIESYDVSHHAGRNAVGGCVVYTTEGKSKTKYRSYNISKENQGNDIGSMLEILERRFKKEHISEIPSLIIIDGGRAHLDNVLKKFKELNIIDTKVIAISKGARRRAIFDTIHMENNKSVLVNPGSIFHNFIQEIRDETHRYSITLQKKKMSKVSIKSSMDGLSGVGKIRKKILLRYFGSLEQVKRASIQDLCEVPGIGETTAKSIYRELHSK
tara:strand:- start:7652 stop:9493 length:1842 start_codon:yes stop_codon:yes gene_type:complete